MTNQSLTGQQAHTSEARMDGYSEQSIRLAEEVKRKAIRNLERAGRVVIVDPETGRITVLPRD